MMRRCAKCARIRPIVLTVFGRVPLHYCARCAPREAVKYGPLPQTRRPLKSFFNAEPLRYKFGKGVQA